MDLAYNRSYFILWPLQRNVTSTLKLLDEECRVDFNCIFASFLMSGQNFICYGSFQVLHSKLSYTHYRIVFFPCIHKTRFLPLILHSVHSFTCVFDMLSCTAAPLTLERTFAALCWSDNSVAQMFSTAVPPELLSVPQRDILNWT